MGKEFFFMMYDELKNKSISKKIDQMKQFTSTRGVYTEDMVQRIDIDTYELVRQPYMKFSKQLYYFISSMLYLVNFVTAVYFLFITNGTLY